MASPSLTGDRMAGPALTCHEARPSPLVNGVRIDPVTPEGLLMFFDSCLRCGRAHVAHFLAADPTVLARRDPRYRQLLNQGDLNLPDGMGVVWAIRLSGWASYRVSGTEGLHLVARWGLNGSLSHYLFGGSPRVVAACRDALEAAHPGIRIAGAESPPFRPITPEEMAEAASRIRGAGAGVVWVGHEVFLIASDGQVIKMKVRDISRQGRDTTGVRVMRLDPGVTIAAIAPVNEDII
jgi:exopolysaccharide biosynthesis WecB/TagA/CpsF family protein